MGSPSSEVGAGTRDYMSVTMVRQGTSLANLSILKAPPAHPVPPPPPAQQSTQASAPPPLSITPPPLSITYLSDQSQSLHPDHTFLLNMSPNQTTQMTHTTHSFIITTTTRITLGQLKTSFTIVFTFFVKILFVVKLINIEY